MKKLKTAFLLLLFVVVFVMVGGVRTEVKDEVNIEIVFVGCEIEDFYKMLYRWF